MTAATDGAIDFSRLIDRSLDGYIEREPIERELRDAAAAAGRCTVVVGEPGSGKTALAADLVRSIGCPHHFLGGEQNDVTLWSDPYAFLTSVGFQLKARYGDELFPPTVDLDVQGRVRNLDDEGSYVGAHVQRLVAVPWHSANVRVRLDAKGIRGEAVGARIDELVEEYRAIPLPAYRQMALIDPLSRLRRLRPQETVTLVVDALADTGPSSVASVLPRAGDLTEIGNLALVLLSRPGRHLDAFLDGSAPLDVGASRFADANEAVVRAFVERELSDAAVRAGLGVAEEGQDTLGDEIVERADGNFLYLRQFFLAARDGGGPALLAGGLPDGLESVYGRIVGNLVTGLGADRYLERVHPIMSSLAVARDALTRDQLERFSGLSAGDVKSALGALAAFLDARGATYTLYHGSFREFVVEPQRSEADWHVDEREANARIARAYWIDGTLDEVDDYGLAHLTQHLARGDGEARERLLALVAEPWRALKRRRLHSNWSFTDDVQLAAGVAGERSFPVAAAHTGRLTLMRSVLEDVVEQIPDRTLDVMVRVGQLQRALDYVGETADAGTAAARIRQVVRGLQSDDGERLPVTISAVRTGLSRLREDPRAGLGLAMVLEECPASDHPGMAELVQEAMEVFDRHERGWWTPRNAAEIARLLAPLEPGLAADWFAQTLQASVDTLTTSLWLELARIFRHWAAFDPEEAEQRARTVSWAATKESAEALLAVGAAHDDARLASWVQTVDEQLVPALTDPYDRAHTLLRLAVEHHRLGDRTAAIDRLERALEAIARIGDADDPNAGLSDRDRYVTTALIAASVTASTVDPSRVEGLLRSAWSSLEAVGAWEPERCLEDLVRVQLGVSRDLLEAQTHGLASQETKVGVMLATAAQLAERDPSAATELLDEALIGQERQTRQWTRFVAPQLAPWFDPEHREATAAWLDETQADPDTIVAWGLGLLPRLTEGAGEWLRATIDIWTGPMNPHRLYDLPAAVAQMPAARLADASAALEAIESPTHRALLAAAIAAGLASEDPVEARRLHESAVSAADALGPGFGSEAVPRHLLLAFLAGQRAAGDRDAANALLLRALLELDGDPSLTDPERRMVFLVDLLQKVMLGSADLALPHLLAAHEPPLPPNTLRLVMPGPGVEPLSMAGMSDRDRLLALALGRSVPGDPCVRDYLATAPAAVRALALAEAAKAAAPLDVRLGWAEQAAVSALEVPATGLSCLLAAGAAGAFGAVGVRRRQQELAGATAERAVAGAGSRGSVQQMGCAYALGRTLEQLEDQEEVLRLLWDAARLGTNELAVVVAHLPARLAAGEPAFPARLRDALRDADTLFGPSRAPETRTLNVSGLVA